MFLFQTGSIRSSSHVVPAGFRKPVFLFQTGSIRSGVVISLLISGIGVSIPNWFD